MPKQTENVSIHFAARTLQAQAELEKKGYVLPHRPIVDLPRVPPHPSDLRDSELMDLFSALVRWSDHIAGVLGMCEIDERVCESIYDMAYAEILATNAPKTRSDGSVTIAKALTSQHHQVVEAEDAKDMAYARRKVMQIMATNLERDTQLVSRELTRRTSRYDHEVRRDGYGA